MRLNIKNYILIFGWIIFLGHWSLAGAADGVGLDPSSTLFNARDLGMGGVSLGFADDACGVFTNPAGMTELKFPQLSAASRKLVLDETQYTLLCWSMPTDFGTFGLGYSALNTGGSIATRRDPATTRIIIDPSREADSFDDNVLAFSYSRNVRPDLAVGGALKMFNQTLSGGVSSRASSFGLDLAAVYKPLSWLSAAADLQNLLEGNLKWENGSADKLGGFYKLGCKVYILGTSEALRSYDQQLYGGIDLDIPHDALSSAAYHLGLDYSPLKNIFLRTGLNLASGGAGLTFGVGLINGGFRFDYAYAQRPGLPDDNPHYFSLSYIGERVLTVGRKIRKKTPLLKFLSPRDQLVTDLDSITFSAEAWADKVVEQKRTWTVTAVSATYDSFEVNMPERLASVFLNGKPVGKHGTDEVIEGTQELAHGRNVIQLLGFTSPEVVGDKAIQSAIGTAELRVLRVAPFSDTPVSLEAADPIYLNVTLGLVTGYPDNSFKPDKGITRAELVTLLVKSLGVPQETLDSYGSAEIFTDVPLKHWAAKYIAHGSGSKLVSGYPDGTFQPNKVLSRVEGITILARYAGLPEETVTASPFPDLKADFWGNKFIAPAKKAGMLKYLEGKDFEFAKEFTRAEACEVLYRVPAIQTKVKEFWDTGIVTAASTR